MILSTKSLGFSLTPGLKEFVETRTRAIVSRHGHKVSRVDVTLLDVNGPKGGKDKRCRIQLKIEGAPAVVIQGTDKDMYDAIGSCTARLKRTLANKLERERRFKTRGQPRVKFEEQAAAMV